MAIEITGLPAANTMSAGNNGQAEASRENTRHLQGQERIAVKIIDNVTLTQEAKHLSMIEASLSTQSEIDPQRVAELKKEIDSGRYTINPERVADKFINFEAQLME